MRAYVCRYACMPLCVHLCACIISHVCTACPRMCAQALAGGVAAWWFPLWARPLQGPLPSLGPTYRLATLRLVSGSQMASPSALCIQSKPVLWPWARDVSWGAPGSLRSPGSAGRRTWHTHNDFFFTHPSFRPPAPKEEGRFQEGKASSQQLLGILGSLPTAPGILGAIPRAANALITASRFRDDIRTDLGGLGMKR